MRLRTVTGTQRSITLKARTSTDETWTAVQTQTVEVEDG